MIYRLGLATSRPQARQLVRHGHLVNGRKVDVPSYSVRVGEVLSVRQSSKEAPAILHAIEEVKGRGIPEWLSFDPNGLSGRVVSLPTREQINLPVQEQLIVELYSSKQLSSSQLSASSAFTGAEMLRAGAVRVTGPQPYRPAVGGR